MADTNLQDGGCRQCDKLENELEVAKLANNRLRKSWHEDVNEARRERDLAQTLLGRTLKAVDALATKVVEWDDARRRFVDHGFMGDAHEADRLGVEIVADAKRFLSEGVSRT